jgi:hypothetical protein
LGHGFLLFAEKILGGRIALCIKNAHIKNVLGHIYTLISIALLWVFFRLGMRDSLRFLRGLCTFGQGQESAALMVKSMLDAQVAGCFAAAVLAAFPWWKRLPRLNTRRLVPLRRGALIVLLLLVMCALASNAYNPFIYFRF